MQQRCRSRHIITVLSALRDNQIPFMYIGRMQKNAAFSYAPCLAPAAMFRMQFWRLSPRALLHTTAIIYHVIG